MAPSNAERKSPYGHAARLIRRRRRNQRGKARSVSDRMIQLVELEQIVDLVDVDADGGTETPRPWAVEFVPKLVGRGAEVAAGFDVVDDARLERRQPDAKPLDRVVLVAQRTGPPHGRRPPVFNSQKPALPAG